MSNTQPWSQQAWSAADHIYREILDLPFVKQLADGSLPREIFNRYIGQDSLYINRYCRVLCHIASRLPEKEMTESFIGFAGDGVEVERALHSIYLSDRPEEMSPVCMMYTSVLMSQAYAPVEVEAASVLPCFWVYLKVGKHIAATAHIDNPYADWIAAYSNEEFDAATERAIAICDKLAARSSEGVRRRMTEIYLRCSRLEWLFWQTAYEPRPWEV